MRLGAIALIAGSVALVVLVIVLWRMTRVSPDPNAARMPTAAAPTEPAESSLASPATPTPATARGRSGAVQLPPAPAPTGTPPPATPSDSPALPGAADSDKKKVPLATKAVLREHVATLDAAVTECVRRYGQGVSGTANLQFTLAPIKGKAVVESTGVIEEGTTVTNADLLDCMHKTALPLQFPFVPDSIAVYARRVVRIDNGKMVDQHLVNFSYVP